MSFFSTWCYSTYINNVFDSVSAAAVCSVMCIKILGKESDPKEVKKVVLILVLQNLAWSTWSISVFFVLLCFASLITNSIEMQIWVVLFVLYLRSQYSWQTCKTAVLMAVPRDVEGFTNLSCYRELRHTGRGLWMTQLRCIGRVKHRRVATVIMSCWVRLKAGQGRWQGTSLTKAFVLFLAVWHSGLLPLIIPLCMCTPVMFWVWRASSDIFKSHTAVLRIDTMLCVSTWSSALWHLDMP